MNILVVGSGGREHALCWRLAQCPDIDRLVCAPGNAGTRLVAENIPVGQTDIDGLVNLALEMAADLVVIGPEAPLALGLADRLRAHDIPTFGPSQSAARIETSKTWAKDVMRDAGVPTARHVVVTDLPAGIMALGQFRFPLVIKADGLAAGKGVVIVNSYEEAVMALTALLEEHTLGDAASAVLIEEYLTGPEVSVFALTDGTAIRILSPACDHKRAYDRDKGPNTGGMGAYAPTTLVDGALLAMIEQTILEPTIRTMREMGCPMNGVLYAGLMLTEAGPKVLEFNARFGDPETQVVLPLLDGDFAALCLAVATGTLADYNVTFHANTSTVGVVMASGGYPGPFATGKPITGLDAASSDALIFHAGTNIAGNGDVVSSGGRVLTVVGVAPTLTEARLYAYAATEQIHFKGAFFRTDIGQREHERQA